MGDRSCGFGQLASAQASASSHRSLLVVRLMGPAVPVAVAVDAGVMVGYLPGPSIRRCADLHSGQAKIDARDAVIVAEAVRKMSHTLRTIALDDEQVAELSMSCGLDDDLRAPSTAVSNRARGLLTQIRNGSWAGTWTTPRSWT